jgi:prepilin-type N-terminal cleavage/methylation domain-containing protein/prepilin-type processing-associated H-X9-DG protein
MTRNLSRAFTMIELLMVLALVAVLAAIAYPTFIGIQERAKVVKDMNNLRQIGIATQLYLNDNDGALPGSATVDWMSQLHSPKYLSSWKVFQSPFDIRGASELGDATTPVSYGINGNNIVGTSADKISKPTNFILFAPAQDVAATVSFQGTAATGAPGVTVAGAGSDKATSIPGGDATGGTHSSRTKINALFADLHVENMPWGGVGVAFTNNTPNPPSDPDGYFRWNPF